MNELEKVQFENLADAVQKACEAMEQAEILIGQLRLEVEFWKNKAEAGDND
jgi:hypothetical protein